MSYIFSIHLGLWSYMHYKINLPGYKSSAFLVQTPIEQWLPQGRSLKRNSTRCLPSSKPSRPRTPSVDCFDISLRTLCGSSAKTVMFGLHVDASILYMWVATKSRSHQNNFTRIAIKHEWRFLFCNFNTCAMRQRFFYISFSTSFSTFQVRGI